MRDRAAANTALEAQRVKERPHRQRAGQHTRSRCGLSFSGRLEGDGADTAHEGTAGVDNCQSTQPANPVHRSAIRRDYRSAQGLHREGGGEHAQDAGEVPTADGTTHVGTVAAITSFYQAWMAQQNWTFLPDASRLDPAATEAQGLGYATQQFWCNPPRDGVDIIVEGDANHPDSTTVNLHIAADDNEPAPCR